jgi:hypothetical protein
MRIVLRNKETGHYLKRPGVWVSGMDDAMTFEDKVEAREYCQAHRVENVLPVQQFMPFLMSLLRRSEGPSTGV